VRRVTEYGWGGIKNGQLLRLAEDQFDFESNAAPHFKPGYLEAGMTLKSRGIV
jgi:hypothetical protein